MEAVLEHLELEAVADGHEDLAVQDAAVGELLAHRRRDLGEVAGERLGVARRQLDLVAVLEDDAAEPVPLRLERQAVAVASPGRGSP